MAKSKVQDNGPLGVSATIKAKKPGKGTHYLSNISIEPAENGFVVSCGYRAKPQTTKSYECGSYMPDEKSVFEDYKGVAKFINSKLTELSDGE